MTTEQRPAPGLPEARRSASGGAVTVPGARVHPGAPVRPRRELEPAVPVPSPAGWTHAHPLVQRLQLSVQRDDLRHAEALSRVLLSEGCPLQVLFDDVLGPLATGLDGWALATAEARRVRLLLTALVSRLRGGGGGRRPELGTMAFACHPEGFLETYMVAAVMELRGWRTVQLGALSLHDLDELVAEPQLSAVVVGVAGTSSQQLRDYCRRTRSLLPGVVVLAHGAQSAAARSAGPDACSGSVAEAAQQLARLTTPLSGRELAILGHVARGLTNKQVAALLSVAPSTVKSHLDRVFDKLGAPDRAAAVAQAVRAGWIV